MDLEKMKTFGRGKFLSPLSVRERTLIEGMGAPCSWF